MKRHLLFIALFSLLGLSGAFAQNYSLNFSSGNYVRIPISSSLHGFNSFTMECWYYEVTSGEEILIGNEYFGCPYFRFGYSAGGSISGGISDCTNSVNYSGQTIQNQWVHLAMSYDGTTFRFFVNGNIVYSQTVTLINIGASDQDIVINRHTWDGGSSSRLTGQLDELRISNICRYNANFTPQSCEFESDINTMGLWHFNENGGSQSIDASGNNNNAILVNGSGWSTNVPFTCPIEIISGLIAYYPFNGNANDESGNNHNCIVNGATLTTDRFGNVNMAYNFDGNSDYISTSANVIIGIQRSICFWAKLPNIYTSPGTIPVSLSSDFNVSFGSWGFAVFSISPSWVGDTSCINDGNWHFYTITSTTGFKNGVSFYQDGLLLNNINFDLVFSYLASNSQLIFGKNIYGAQSYLGLIDDIRIYNRALNSTEIDSLYHENGYAALTDIDGNVYNTVNIGTQVWMRENLKTTKYSNGDAIPNVTDNGAWAGLSTSAYCDYNNNSSNSATYGRFYNGYAVHDVRNICPTGWHVPTDLEWKTLEMELGMTQSDADNAGWRGTNQGNQLKETGTVHWLNGNAGTNSSGFSALPSGYRFTDGTYTNVGYTSAWYTSTENISGNDWCRSLSYDDGRVNRASNSLKFGFSVRCIKKVYSIEVGSINTKVGQSFDVHITTLNLNSNDSIIAYQFNFDYDAAKIQYVSTSIVGTIAEGGNVLVNSTTAGHLVVGYTTTTPLSGAGDIVKLHFSALAEGTSALTVSNFLFNATTVTSITNGVATLLENIPPTAAITYSDADALVHPGQVLTITATFNEPMADSPVPQISLGGATTLVLTNMTKVSNTVYTYSYTVEDVNGTINVNMGTGTDIAENIVVSAPTGGATFVVDNIEPTAAITYSDADILVHPGEVVIITATFNETMADSPLPQIALSGATTLATTNMSKVSATVYTYSYTVANVNGTINVALSTGTDIAGNIVISAPTSGASFIADNIAPTAAITYSDADAIVRAGDVLIITATFSEPMVDSPVPQISLSGATTLSASNMTKFTSTVYTYSYTVENVNGTINVSLATGTDIAGNLITSTPSGGGSFIADNTSPTAVITYSDADGEVRIGAVLVITATFNEAMSDSPVPQIILSGGNTVSATNMTKVSVTVYTYTHTVEFGVGNVNVSLSAGTDIVGNVVVSTPTSGGLFSIIPLNYGDIDDDGNIYAYDAALTLQYSVGIDPIPSVDPLPWETWRILTADVDSTGDITANDASLILQYAIGLISTFPVETKVFTEGVADVVLTVEGNFIVFRSSGELFGLNVYVNENKEILSAPEVLDGNMMTAFKINADSYALGLCTAYAPAESSVFMKIPFQTSEDLNLSFNMIINTEIKSVSVSVTGIEGQMNATGVKIYPNPAGSKIQVAGISKPEEYHIRDLTGRTIQEGRIQNNSIGLECLNPGIYILEINHDRMRLVKE